MRAEFRWSTQQVQPSTEQQQQVRAAGIKLTCTALTGRSDPLGVLLLCLPEVLQGARSLSGLALLQNSGSLVLPGLLIVRTTSLILHLSTGKEYAVSY